MNISVAEIAELVGGVVCGDGATTVTGVNGLGEAGPGDLSFLGAARYLPLMADTRASAVLVPHDFADSGVPLIQVENPYLAMVAVLNHFQADLMRHPKGIHPTAVVDKNAVLGENVALGPHTVIAEGTEIGDNTIVYPGVYIGHSCQIGPDTLIYPNATIRERVTIGARCVIHGGVVLGTDGFGFAQGAKNHEKIPHVGRVVIGDDVEIGACSAIDRATFGATVVGNGTKIDNHVQIGHNVSIGTDSIICGCAGIAGSTNIGNNVTIAAGAGFAGHLEVGDGAIIAAYSGVTKSVKPGQVLFGYPAVEHTLGKRMHAALRHLPEALRRMRKLEERIVQLEGQSNGPATEDDS
jgi:UDP-3-O-[3-hydroxymyristoyl] glucosamine N-acyltransferase